MTSSTDNAPAVPKRDEDKIVIFDTTLRDGEQCPGATMTFEEKLQVAELLDDMGVDIIEAGFPIASEGDFEAVTEIAKLAKQSVICGLARANFDDIERAGEAVKLAKRGRIHTFIGTSPLHRQHQLQLRPGPGPRACDRVGDTGARLHRRRRVERDGRDAHRARLSLPRLRGGDPGRRDDDQYSRHRRLCAAGGVFRPDHDAAERACRAWTRSSSRPIATTTWAWRSPIRWPACSAGARQIECTINGLGERAGNAALEEIVMAIRTRHDLLPYHTGIKTEMLSRASKLVSAVTNFPVQYNKAIVGRNAFAHESGIHQDGVLKNAETYEIMTPELVGIGKSSLVMGKHSGRAAFKSKLQELGYDLGDNAIEDAFNRFKALADRKKHVYDDDIEALVDDGVAHMHDRIKVAALDRHRRNDGSAVGDADARYRRAVENGAEHRQRTCRCNLQRHQAARSRTTPASISTRFTP